jgi:hypothetical protein
MVAAAVPSAILILIVLGIGWVFLAATTGTPTMTPR